LNDAVPNVPRGGGLVDRVMGKAKDVIGSITGNDQLRQEGALHQEKADAEHEAQRRATTADQIAAEAEVTSKAQELAAERDRLLAEEAEAAERDRLERESAQRQAKVEHDAATRQRAADRDDQAAKVAVASQEAAALNERQASVQSADRIEQEAQQARRRAEALDAAQSAHDEGA
jgi:uncharacterized protein YjbJ (UPF0337 family)